MTSSQLHTSIATDLATCHNVRSLMEAFIDGELSPEQTLEMEAHVDDCPACQANAEFLRTLSATIKGVVHADINRRTTQLTLGETRANAELVVAASVADGTVPSTFMARLERAIEAEIEREAVATDQTSRGAWIGRISVFAAAASATLWFGFRAFAPETSALATASDGAPLQARNRSTAQVAGSLQDEEVPTL